VTGATDGATGRDRRRGPREGRRAGNRGEGRAGNRVHPTLDGILVLDKPAGPTSHDMVGLLRRLSGTHRIGHGGTLDPFANGVLPLFLGSATRVVEYHLGDRKTYRATICFGASSTTDDLEGTLEPAIGPAPTAEQVDAVLERFRGTIEQRPPAHSAIKIGGRRAYALARAGQSVELKPRTVTIHRLDVLEFDATDPNRPIAIVEVECSAGTYVRALARDLGAATENAAYLGALTRLASGPFGLDRAATVDVVRNAASAGPEGLRALLLPVDAGLEGFPQIELSADELAAVIRGQFIRPSAAPPAADRETPLRLIDARGGLIGIGRWEDGRIVPDKVLVPVREAS
jgi:tRNA pseudouridine55 synthase